MRRTTEAAMKSMRTFPKALCAFALLPVLGSGAQAFDLSGVWADHSSVCAKIFVKRNNRIAFTKDADSFGSGFIVEGNRIRGKIAACAIKMRKEDGAVLHLHTTCSTDVAL